MKRTGLVVTALLLAVLLAAPAAQTQSLTKIRQAGFKVIDLAVPLLAKSKGIFQKNGTSNMSRSTAGSWASPRS